MTTNESIVLAVLFSLFIVIMNFVVVGLFTGELHRQLEDMDAKYNVLIEERSMQLDLDEDKTVPKNDEEPVINNESENEEAKDV